MESTRTVHTFGKRKTNPEFSSGSIGFLSRLTLASSTENSGEGSRRNTYDRQSGSGIGSSFGSGSSSGSGCGSGFTNSDCVVNGKSSIFQINTQSENRKLVSTDKIVANEKDHNIEQISHFSALEAAGILEIMENEKDQQIRRPWRKFKRERTISSSAPGSPVNEKLQHTKSELPIHTVASKDIEHSSDDENPISNKRSKENNEQMHHAMHVAPERTTQQSVDESQLQQLQLHYLQNTQRMHQKQQQFEQKQKQDEEQQQWLNLKTLSNAASDAASKTMSNTVELDRCFSAASAETIESDIGSDTYIEPVAKIRKRRLTALQLEELQLARDRDNITGRKKDFAARETLGARIGLPEASVRFWLNNHKRRFVVSAPVPTKIFHASAPLPIGNASSKIIDNCEVKIANSDTESMHNSLQRSHPFLYHSQIHEQMLPAIQQSSLQASLNQIQPHGPQYVNSHTSPTSQQYRLSFMQPSAAQMSSRIPAMQYPRHYSHVIPFNSVAWLEQQRFQHLQQQQSSIAMPFFNTKAANSMLIARNASQFISGGNYAHTGSTPMLMHPGYPGMVSMPYSAGSVAGADAFRAQYADPSVHMGSQQSGVQTTHL